MNKTYCNCGCGQITTLAKYTCKSRGWKKGEPINYIHGHNMKGKKREIPAMLGKHHSIETRRKMYESSRKGSDCNLWKGGVYKINELLRRSAEYRIWRTKVYQRDNYTCQICEYRGHNLQVDHIQSWSKYPELRFIVDNGRTLCIPCHKKTETYGINLRYA